MVRRAVCMQARQQAHYFKQGLNFLSYKSLPTRFDVFLSVGTLKNRSFTAFGVSRSEIGIAGRPDATLPSHPGQGVTRYLFERKTMSTNMPMHDMYMDLQYNIYSNRID